MLLENGVYRAVVKDISVHLRTTKDKEEREVERLTGSFRLECEGKELVHKEWLELNSGTISDKIIKRLRECFPKWDGSIETLEQGFCVQGVEVQITVENEQDREDPDKWWTRTKLMYRPGGSSGGAAALPDKESRATLVGKYGSRFRALAGGMPAMTEVRGQQSEVPPSRGSSGVASSSQMAEGGNLKPEREDEGSIEHQGRKGSEERMGPPPMRRETLPAVAQGAMAGKLDTPPRVSSLEECWDALCKKHPGEFREQVSERWFKLLEQVGEGKDQADFGPEDWGRVMGVIALPF